jgi:hypothetical protein
VRAIAATDETEVRAILQELREAVRAHLESVRGKLILASSLTSHRGQISTTKS